MYVQEEPRNMGSYRFVADLLAEKMGVGSLPYIGRATSSSPAVGSKRVHKIEQERLLTEAIGPAPDEANASG